MGMVVASGFTIVLVAKRHKLIYSTVIEQALKKLFFLTLINQNSNSRHNYKIKQRQKRHLSSFVQVLQAESVEKVPS